MDLSKLSLFKILELITLMLIIFACISIFYIKHNTKYWRTNDSSLIGYSFLSTRSSYLTLAKCDELLGILAPAFTSEEDAKNCQQIAKKLQDIHPRHAYAAYIEAKAHWFFDDDEVAMASLNQSLVLAPNESWLAMKRLLFIYNQLAPESSLDSTIFWNDYQAALYRSQYHSILASLALRNREIRERLIEMIPSLPRNAQNSILHQLRVQE